MKTLPLELSEQLAHDLGASDLLDVAFLIDCARLYFARHPRPRAAHEPSSAIVRLIQGIHEREPGQARRIVRNRVFSTSQPTEMCSGMVRVAARRLTAGINARDHALAAPAFERVDLTNAFTAPALRRPEELLGRRSHDGFMRLTLEAAALVPRESGPRYALDRAIAALLVSSEGELLAWALNSNARNRTLHAELKLAQGWHQASGGKPLPRGARLYVTLKPCRMCAAMLWEACEDPRTLSVFYAEHDPGPNARDTVFNRPGLDIERQWSVT